MGDSADNLLLLKTVGHATTSVFAAMAAYITIVEAPARAEVDPQEGLHQFRASYPRAVRIMPALAAVAGVSSIGAWWMSRRRLTRYLIGGIAIGAVIPFTFAAMMPINKRLLDKSTALGALEARGLLDKWSSLHNVRTLLAVVALVALLPRFPFQLSLKV